MLDEQGGLASRAESSRLDAGWPGKLDQQGQDFNWSLCIKCYPHLSQFPNILPVCVHFIINIFSYSQSSILSGPPTRCWSPHLLTETEGMGLGVSLEALWTCWHSAHSHQDHLVSENSQVFITYQGDIVELELKGCHYLEHAVLKNVSSHFQSVPFSSKLLGASFWALASNIVGWRLPMSTTASSWPPRVNKSVTLPFN